MGDPRADEYYIRIPRLKVEPQAEPASPAPEVRLASGSGRSMQLVMSVMIVIVGILAGLAVPFLLQLFLIIGFWGYGDSDRTFLIGLGVFIASCGIFMGIVSWLPWRRRPALRFDDDSVSIRYPGFARPLEVPRALVRVVAIDDRPVVLFQRNDRFPVLGEVPEAAFVDALDRHPSNPWDPPAPDSRRPGFPIPSPLSRPKTQHLFSADGSALPLFRVNAEDIPNLAIILDESVRTPRAPLGIFVGCRAPVIAGGRRIRGMLLRVAEPARAAEAFGRWSVVRDVTAQDVLEERLLLPKPLKGLRAAIYSAVLLLPLVLRILVRNRF